MSSSRGRRVQWGKGEADRYEARADSMDAAENREADNKLSMAGSADEEEEEEEEVEDAAAAV